MDLYFLPLACSTATRICLYEAGAEATFVEVDPKTKRASTGESLFDLNPVGLVPTLRIEGGEVLTENAAILQYVAERFPAAKLAPSDAAGRRRLHAWLSFVATELHKTSFGVLLDKKAPKEAKTYAAAVAADRLDVLAKHLQGRDYVLDTFSLVDAYLVTVLGWAQVTPVDLARWPAITAYVARVRERPAVARALGEELQLYLKAEGVRATAP